MASLDFCREKRLLLPGQFKAVFDSPEKKFYGKGCLLLAKRNTSDLPRLGLMIGKKNVKLSVQRNRVKRQVRESFRTHQQVLRGWDFVFIARRGLGDLSNQLLSRQCLKLWHQLDEKKTSDSRMSSDSNSSESSGKCHA